MPGDKLSPDEHDKRKLQASTAEKAGDSNSVELEKSKEAAERDKTEHKKMQKVVFVKNKDNTVKMVPVETGIADNAYLEVKGGVRPARKSSAAVIAPSAGSSRTARR